MNLKMFVNFCLQMFLVPFCMIFVVLDWFEMFLRTFLNVSRLKDIPSLDKRARPRIFVFFAFFASKNCFFAFLAVINKK